jgi:hypothetical protein
MMSGAYKSSMQTVHDDFTVFIHGMLMDWQSVTASNQACSTSMHVVECIQDAVIIQPTRQLNMML